MKNNFYRDNCNNESEKAKNPAEFKNIQEQSLSLCPRCCNCYPTGMRGPTGPTGATGNTRG